jgi:protein HIRA/HIR1
VENWRVYRRLIGHDNDVQDLGWSPDSSILVSVGLDSKVVVWSGHTFEKLKTISSHKSHVKGITFDPANKYFATAADDRTLKIFRFTPPGPTSTAHDQANNFNLETTISAPFESSPLTTYFRRCSWSPDAACIAAANGVNGPLSSAIIIYRGTWQTDINLIGHEGPLEVCAFSPRLYNLRRPDDPDSPSNLVSMVACAGQDRALSVWATVHPRPLVVAFDLALKSISDLAWHPDGSTLFVTALDGSVLAVVFQHDDIGKVTSLDENLKSISKYGTGRRGAGFVEGPVGLLLEEKSKAVEMSQAEGRMQQLMGNGMVAGQAPPSNMANGGGALTPDTRAAAEASNTPSNADERRPQPNGHGAGDPTKPDPTKPDPKTQQQTDPDAVKLEKLKQRVTITSDGKKRVAPLLVAGKPGSAQTSLPSSQLVAATMEVANTDASQPVLDLSEPYDKLPKGGLTALLIGNKRKLADPEGREGGSTEKRIKKATRDGEVPVLVNTVQGLALPSSLPAEVEVDPTPEFLRPAVVNPSLSTSQLRLAVPALRSRISFVLDPHNDMISRLNQAAKPADGSLANQPGSASGLVLDVRNPPPPAAGRSMERQPSRVSVNKGAQTVWQDFLFKPVLLVTGNSNFWAAACEEGSIYAWTPAGRRLLNAIVVDAQPVIFESRAWWLLCVTAVGMCHVWNLQSISAPHAPVSLAPILNIASLVMRGSDNHLQPGPAVTAARLNSRGQIVVTLSNGEGYLYSSSLRAWQRVSETLWAAGSHYWNTIDSSVGSLSAMGLGGGAEDDDAANSASAGVISFLERRTNQEVFRQPRGGQMQRWMQMLFSREGLAGLESTVSIAHLENRIAAALQLGARHDFRVNLFMYAKRLGAENLHGKLEELLKGLLGGIDEDTGDDDGLEGASRRHAHGDETWHGSSEQLCGWDRHELLKGVILLLGKFRSEPFFFLSSRSSY